MNCAYCKNYYYIYNFSKIKIMCNSYNNLLSTTVALVIKKFS